MSDFPIRTGDWWRDGNGLLWIGAYPTSPTPDSKEVLFILYGLGAEPRFYKPNGEYIPHTGIGSGPIAFNLVRMVERREPHYDA